MSVRVQVILDEAEVSRFRSRARKESKSLSAWLRDAGRAMLVAEERRRLLDDKDALRDFFKACDRREGTAAEPDWDEHKKVLAGSYRAGANP
jgi:hypothetical protein